MSSAEQLSTADCAACGQRVLIEELDGHDEVCPARGGAGPRVEEVAPGGRAGSAAADTVGLPRDDDPDLSRHGFAVTAFEGRITRADTGELLDLATADMRVVVSALMVDVRRRLVARGLKPLGVPIAADREQPHLFCNVYASEGWNTAQKLYVFMQGARTR